MPTLHDIRLDEWLNACGLDVPKHFQRRAHQILIDPNEWAATSAFISRALAFAEVEIPLLVQTALLQQGKLEHVNRRQILLDLDKNYSRILLKEAGLTIPETSSFLAKMVNRLVHPEKIADKRIENLYNECLDESGYPKDLPLRIELTDLNNGSYLRHLNYEGMVRRAFNKNNPEPKAEDFLKLNAVTITYKHYSEDFTDAEIKFLLHHELEHRTQHLKRMESLMEAGNDLARIRDILRIRTPFQTEYACDRAGAYFAGSSALVSYKAKNSLWQRENAETIKIISVAVGQALNAMLPEELQQKRTFASQFSKPRYRTATHPSNLSRIREGEKLQNITAEEVEKGMVR